MDVQLWETNHSRLRVSLSVGLAIMLMLAGTAAGFSNPDDPNVVVLRSERRVTVQEPALTLRQIAESLSRQTGYSFEIDERLAREERTYGLLLSSLPLWRALSAISHVSGGVWEEDSRRFLLRPRSGVEVLRNLAHYEKAIQDLKESLESIMASDSSTELKGNPSRDAIDLFLRTARGNPLTSPLLQPDRAERVDMFVQDNTFGFIFVTEVAGGRSVNWQNMMIHPRQRSLSFGRSPYLEKE
jgi:hypothetical protein